MTAPVPPDRLAARLLAERTRMLAERGRVPVADAAAVERRLVCEDGGTLLAFAPELVRTIRECRFEPVAMLRPAAMGIVLGITLFEGHLVSVLAAARLFGIAGPAPEPGGVMLMLRPVGSGAAPSAPVALRVDRSLGLRGIEPHGDSGPDGAADRDRAWLRPDAGADGEPDAGERMVRLIGAREIATALAALDPSLISPGA